MDAESGRSASRVELRRRLPGAPPAYLDGALDNPETGAPEVLLLLLNRRATGAQIARIAADPRFSRNREFDRRLALHPGSPPRLARRLLDRLGCMDLAEVMSRSGVAPAVSRKAEDLLINRVDGLALGERIALARRATGRRVAAMLGESTEARVLRALLANPRFSLADGARMAASATAPQSILRELEQHPLFGPHPAVRIALAGNPRTPVAVALRILERLPVADLRCLTNDGKVPAIVRIGAARKLERGGPRDPGSRRAGPRRP